jgi:ABC-type sugar transport system permease subunit
MNGSSKNWSFVGFRNFERLFGMGIFAESIGHTLVFLVGYVSLTLVLGFIIALLLNRKLRLSGLYITLLFIPWIIADIIVGIVFRLLVLPDYGLLTGFLDNPALFPPTGLSVLTAVPPQPWLGDFPFPPAPAMIYLILASAWRALPFITLLLLAAMQTVSTEVIESSRIDGANGWQVVRRIMIPLMLPTLVVAIFSLTLSGMNGVGMVFSLTAAGQARRPRCSATRCTRSVGRSLTLAVRLRWRLLIAAVNWALIMATLRVTRVEERNQ